MVNLRSLGLLGLVLSLVLSPISRAADAPATDADPLKDKGLVKAGTTYVLPVEQELSDQMKTLRKLKVKLDSEAKERRQLESQLTLYKNGISNLDYQRRQVLEKYLKLTDNTQKNAAVAEANILESKLKQANDERGELEKRLNGLGAEEKTQFINEVIDLGQKVDKAKDQYKDLAADPDVKHTVDMVNQSGTAKVKLGPSPEYVTNVALLGKWRGDVASETIDVKTDNSVPVVEVTLNGTLTRDMVFDSGAGIVSLPADVAKQLNMIPTDKDQTINIIMADGKQVEAKLMTLKSVRVGQFTVADVECAVLPASLVAAQPLLGGTFLNNFVFKMDPAAKQLHLAVIAGNTRVTTAGGPKSTKKTPAKSTTP